MNVKICMTTPLLKPHESSSSDKTNKTSLLRNTRMTAHLIK